MGKESAVDGRDEDERRQGLVAFGLERGEGGGKKQLEEKEKGKEDGEEGHVVEQVEDRM